MFSLFFPLFQSTPSAWRETHPGNRSNYTNANFNPLPPHGGRLSCVWALVTALLFQSTPSAWRETFPPTAIFTVPHYFNPLPPHGGRLSMLSTISLILSFQSTPSAWRETTVQGVLLVQRSFQSTPSAWRETRKGKYSSVPMTYFNPLPPHGGRPHKD